MSKGRRALALKIHFPNGQVFHLEAGDGETLFVEVDGPSITVKDNGVLKQYVNVPFQVAWEETPGTPIMGLNW